MDYIQIVNLNELRALNAFLVGTRIAVEHQEKALHWLNHNVLNAIVDVALMCVDTWFEKEEKLYEHVTDIKYHYYATASAVQHRKMEARRLDVHRLSAAELQAHDEGAVLLGLHAFEEYGEAVVHFIEALCVKMGHKKHWDSINLAVADNLAKQWVKELQALAVASGGKVREIGVFEGFSLVKLEDQDAYISEGQVMHHCVAGEWGKTNEIYSLRKGGERYATIEVRGSTVVQAKGKFNINPRSHETEGEAVGKALTAAFFTLNWKLGQYRSPGIEVREIDTSRHAFRTPSALGVWPFVNPIPMWPQYQEVFQFDRVAFLYNDRMDFGVVALGRFVSPEANGGQPLFILRTVHGAPTLAMRQVQRIRFIDSGVTIDVSRGTKSETEIVIELDPTAAHTLLTIVCRSSTVRTVADNWGRNMFGMKAD